MKMLTAIGTAAVVAAAGVAAWFFGGFYSVAGTAGDPDIVKWALIQVRTASINRHATQSPPADFSAEGRRPAGARAFAEFGCANCHGAPGVTWAKFSEGLRPDPPDLKEVVGDRSAPQLFWVIKNGINMTGMPSFGLAGAKDDDIWSIVAFLKFLPTVSEAEYQVWTAPAPTEDQSPAVVPKSANE
jgi:mono/diheme cytochrome c family protein